jgi:hypothetical protein
MNARSASIALRFEIKQREGRERETTRTLPCSISLVGQGGRKERAAGGLGDVDDVRDAYKSALSLNQPFDQGFMLRA